MAEKAIDPACSDMFGCILTKVSDVKIESKEIVVKHPVKSRRTPNKRTNMDFVLQVLEKTMVDMKYDNAWLEAINRKREKLVKFIGELYTKRRVKIYKHDRKFGYEYHYLIKLFYVNGYWMTKLIMWTEEGSDTSTKYFDMCGSDVGRRSKSSGKIKMYFYEALRHVVTNVLDHCLI